MITREELAEKIYLHAAFSPESTSEFPKRPFAELPKWEQEVWLRAADVAREEMRGMAFEHLREYEDMLGMDDD